MQYKQINNPNFPSLMLELEELLKDGWQIDQTSLPVDHFTTKVINLVKEESDKKPVGRPKQGAKQ